MDIKRIQKPSQRRTVRRWLVVSAMVLVALGIYCANSELMTRGYSRAGMLVGEVRRGDLRVTVFGSGVLVPREVRWVASSVAGRVNRILVKPGHQVASGELLLELDNPELVQAAEELRWDLEALEAEQVALGVSLESELLNQRARVKTVDLDLQGARWQFDAQDKLVESGLATVSMLEHKKAALRLRQLENDLEAEQLRLERLEKNRDAQLQAGRALVSKLAHNLERARQRVDALRVIAQESGVVQEVPVTLGQRLAAGTNLVRVADQSQLIAELQIPERLINDVALGQPVTVDTRKSRIVGTVSRIDPAVIKGAVTVEVEFAEALPAEARPDLSITSAILVADIADTLYVDRPVLAQIQQSGVAYRLDRTGTHADRTPVRFGQGSANEIQIVSGLAPGDQIILSDHSSWQHLERIAIK